MEKMQEAVDWPELMLADVREQACRLDRSLSWCVQEAWSMTRAELRSLSPQTEPRRVRAYLVEESALQFKQTLFFPRDMLEEIRAEAERLGRSFSWLIQSAWCIAVREIDKLPPSYVRLSV